jgi:hypothetical protein
MGTPIIQTPLKDSGHFIIGIVSILKNLLPRDGMSPQMMIGRLYKIT